MTMATLSFERPAFGAKWRAIAASDPAAFQAGQKAYIIRSHFEVSAKLINARTGYDIHNASNALQQVTYSTSVQHGANGGASIVSNAIKQADAANAARGPGKQLNRGDPAYQAAVINGVYDLRRDHFIDRRNQQLAMNQIKDADHSSRIINNRYPDE